MPKSTPTKLSEKTRNRFSSLISGDESTPSRQRTTTSPFEVSSFLSYSETSSFEKKLDIIYKQNSKIFKTLERLLSGQNRLEERLLKIEERLGETKSEDKDFVDVKIKFFNILHYYNNFYTNSFQLELR